MKAALIIASALLLATMADAGEFLCRLSPDKVPKALDCLADNVKPEVADYLKRLPQKGAGFVINACKASANFEEVMRLIWTVRTPSCLFRLVSGSRGTKRF